MNANLSRVYVVLAIIIVIESGIGCIETPVKVNAINNSQVMKIEAGEEGISDEVNYGWEILVEESPQNNGIDYYKNAGYGVTKVTFQYSPMSGMGTIMLKKTEDDWVNKSRADYYVSGIRLLLMKKSGEVYDTGMIIFKKDGTWAKSISVPKENFIRFKVEEIVISPG